MLYRALRLGPVLCALVSALGCAIVPLRLPPGENAHEVETVCPAAQTDPVCSCVRAFAPACFPELLRGVRERIAVPSQRVDPVVAYFIRQRLVALLIEHAIDWRDTQQLNKALKTYFPAYPPGYFPLALQPIAPAVANGCSSAPELVLLFPGVVRVAHLDEFAAQIEALKKEFPGAIFKVVDSETFSEPADAAALATSIINETDRQFPNSIPIHLLGYSQGAESALWLLATTPSLSSRVKTVVLMNSAARGSEVGNLLFKAVSLLDPLDLAACDSMPHWEAALCQKLVGGPLSPSVRRFVEAAGERLGISLRVPAGSSVSEFLRARLRGLESLTTWSAAGFWTRYGAQLPRTPTYLLFRTEVAERQDLPTSNALFYEWLVSVDKRYPENDMQVRLANQSLPPPLDALQIPAPVAEGNHWQWALRPGDVPTSAMPERMAARMAQVPLFLAIFETLNEVGLYCRP
jgi:pimeloyl-ACP methyl ester carboxylesterase